MKKILSLSTKEWFSGVAQGYNSGGGLWASAIGINPFVDARRGNTRVGLLQASPVVTDLTSTVVTEIPIGWATDLKANTDQALYFNSTGKLYTLNVSGDTGLTALRTVADMANGIGTFQPNGGTKYLYYFQKTQIGRYDLASTYVDNYIGAGGTISTAIEDTVHHPVHKFNDVLLYGNKDRVGSIRDDGAGGITSSTNDLDFESDYTCTTISDDGFYWVIGVTRNTGNGTAVYPGSRIRFWDGNSSSWEREWILPSPDIISIKKVGSRMYALTGNGLYVFSFSTPPIKVHSHLLSDTAGANTTTGGHYSMDVLEDGVVWGSANARLHYYGKMTPEAPMAYHQLFSVPNGTGQMIASSVKNQRIYVGTTTPKFGYYNHSDSGTPDTGVSAESTLIDLKNEYKIGRIDVVLGSKLASGDSLNIGVANGLPSSIQDFQKANAVSYADYGDAISVKLQDTINAELLLIKPTFTAGTVKIKRIDVWGDLVNK